MMRVVPLTLLVLAACGGREAARVDSASAVRAGASTEAAPGPTGSVTERGLGPLRAGMTVAEARAAVPSFSLPTGAGTCDYATAPSLPAGVMVMVENGIVVRIDVDSGGPATAEGARVGDTEENVKKLYAGRVTVSPHKYTNGKYLTVRSATAGDTVHRIVFETDGRRVTKIRAGRVPQVLYVEGCS